MSKIMLLAGCSHSAGSEIDGQEDSEYNRKNSFGSLLAQKLGYTPINIAINGATNSTISRSVIDWYNENFVEDMDLFVLIGWTDSLRIETPFVRATNYKKSNKSIPYLSPSCLNYIRVSMAKIKTYMEDENTLVKEYQEFIVNNLEFMEVLSGTHILNTQYFLESRNINFLMVNTMKVFNLNHPTLNFYFDNFDEIRYPSYADSEESFYIRYEKAGYRNKDTKYRHHPIEAHQDYADCLYEYILENNLLDK